ncbi:hypothetical protein Hanom_Chr13g01220691 [Helianthus anomalus]
MTVPTESLSNLAHTPSFRASLGQLPLRVGGTGRVGVLQVEHACVATKKRRLMARKRVEDLLKAIGSKLEGCSVLVSLVGTVRPDGGCFKCKELFFEWCFYNILK